jgi:RimJ/RimL family protein N-acetyltransferase
MIESDWSLFLALHDDPMVIDKCFDRPLDAQIRRKFIHRLASWQPFNDVPLCLVIIEKYTGKKVGVTGFTSTSLNNQEVGYLLLPAFYGQGYATESLQALIDFTYQQYGISEYTAVVTQGNIGSEKVLKKCGFTLSKVQHNAYEISGVLYDDHHYTLSIEL